MFWNLFNFLRGRRKPDLKVVNVKALERDTPFCNVDVIMPVVTLTPTVEIEAALPSKPVRKAKPKETTPRATKTAAKKPAARKKADTTDEDVNLVTSNFGAIPGWLDPTPSSPVASEPSASVEEPFSGGGGSTGGGGATASWGDSSPSNSSDYSSSYDSGSSSSSSYDSGSSSDNSGGGGGGGD